jgi:hypothetical protein
MLTPFRQPIRDRVGDDDVARYDHERASQFAQLGRPGSHRDHDPVGRNLPVRGAHHKRLRSVERDNRRALEHTNAAQPRDAKQAASEQRGLHCR